MSNFTEYFYGCQMKDNEMGRMCITGGADEKYMNGSGHWND
jgi:hypothetical protein